MWARTREATADIQEFTVSSDCCQEQEGGRRDGCACTYFVVRYTSYEQFSFIRPVYNQSLSTPKESLGTS